MLDVGANLGQYSLYAALLGHQVIAVEAYKPTLDKLHHSILRNNLTYKITLVHNAISDTYQIVTMGTYPDNKGGSYVAGRSENQSKTDAGEILVKTILMDDLVELMTFDHAIMKMDIETYEAKAMKHAEHLLDKVTFFILAFVHLQLYLSHTTIFEGGNGVLMTGDKLGETIINAGLTVQSNMLYGTLCMIDSTLRGDAILEQTLID